MGSIIPLPYWQINIPNAQRTLHCPSYLQNLSAKDLETLSTPDSKHIALTWAHVCSLVHANQLQFFERKPSDLRRYLEHNAMLKREYGSVMRFIVTQRLRWTLADDGDTIDSGDVGAPFERPDDWKVLYNDWPYAVDKAIVHLVVWTKFALPEDQRGQLTVEARQQIDDFVNGMFGHVMEKEKYIWFKNWKALKSVQTVEHFHVMLHDPDVDFINKITGGDVPLSQKV